MTFQNQKVFFAHSFALSNLIVNNSLITSTYTYYKSKIVSSIENNNVYGVQFHPEKSGIQGAKILKNFFEL